MRAFSGYCFIQASKSLSAPELAAAQASLLWAAWDGTRTFKSIYYATSKRNASPSQRLSVGCLIDRGGFFVSL
jgi:hypothetical protein